MPLRHADVRAALPGSPQLRGAATLASQPGRALVPLLGAPASRWRLEPGVGCSGDQHLSRSGAGSHRSGSIQRTHEPSKPLKVARHQRMSLAQLAHEKVQAIPVIFQLEVVTLEVAELEQLQERGEGSL